MDTCICQSLLLSAAIGHCLRRLLVENSVHMHTPAAAAADDDDDDDGDDERDTKTNALFSFSQVSNTTA